MVNSGLCMTGGGKGGSEKQEGLVSSAKKESRFRGEASY